MEDLNKPQRLANTEDRITTEDDSLYIHSDSHYQDMEVWDALEDAGYDMKDWEYIERETYNSDTHTFRYIFHKND